MSRAAQSGPPPLRPAGHSPCDQSPALLLPHTRQAKTKRPFARRGVSASLNDGTLLFFRSLCFRFALGSWLFALRLVRWLLAFGGGLGSLRGLLVLIDARAGDLDDHDFRVRKD